MRSVCMSKLLNIDAAIIVFFMLIFIPPVASGFVLSKYVSGRIVEEKTNKLYGIANTLDKLLTSDYDTILEKYNMQSLYHKAHYRQYKYCLILK